MLEINDNLYLDVDSNNKSSYRSTKQISTVKNSIYAIDDLFNIKYISFLSINKQKEMYISTIKLEMEDKQNFILTGNDNIDSFFDKSSSRRILVSTTNDSDVFGIREMRLKLLTAIG